MRLRVIFKPASSQAAVQAFVGPGEVVCLLGKHLSERPRKAVEESEGYELDCLGRVEMRQVASRMPTLVGHASFPVRRLM